MQYIGGIDGEKFLTSMMVYMNIAWTALTTTFDEMSKAEYDILKKYWEVDMIPFIVFQFISLIIIHRIWTNRKFCVKCMQFIGFISVYALMFLVLFHTPSTKSVNVDDVVYTSELYEKMQQCENPYWMEDLFQKEDTPGAENTPIRHIFHKIAKVVGFENTEDLTYAIIIISLYVGIIFAAMYSLNNMRKKGGSIAR